MSVGLFHKNCVLIVLAILLSACSSKSDMLKEKQADLYFGAGTQSLMSKDYTDALTNMLKANQLKPNYSPILTNLGMAYYFKGERDLAIKTLYESIKHSEDGNSDAKVNLATIYFKDGDVARAERLYKEVLKDLTYDKQARTLYNLGVIALRKQRSVDAENYFKKSVTEDANYCPSYLQIGLLQHGRKQFNSALKNFREATMGTCYESPMAHYYQALTLTKLKRFNDARLKYDEIDAKFKNTEFGAKARMRMAELNELEKNIPAEESHASRKVLESPEF